MQTNFETQLKRCIPLALLLTSAAGMVVNEPTSKITTWLLGSVISGLLYALRFHFYQPAKSEAWQSFVAYSKIKQMEMTNSFYGIYRKIILGKSIPDYPLEFLSIEDTITNFIFIFACFSMGVVLWLEPSIINFQLQQNIQATELVKATILNFLMVTLLSAGFSGALLNVIRWFSPSQE